MIMNCDKFFIAELQKEGYDLDYNKVVEIYRNSRQNDEFKKRKARQLRELAELEAMEAYADSLRLKSLSSD